MIEAVLKGKDVLAVLPTGGGKSACFQVPALLQEGLCLVISPLVALMKNQVESLREKGIEALAIDSSLRYAQVEDAFIGAANGQYRFLYLSPERLVSRLFTEYASSLPVHLIAVDEAHCISQWGYDFRPPYLQIGSLRSLYPGVPIIALTASATLRVQEDILEKLDIKKATIVRHSFARANLSCRVFNPVRKIEKTLDILSRVEGSAILYCRSRRLTQEVSGLLASKGISADYYHAGLDHEARKNKQDQWIANKTRVMVCTNAFGMGIDKPDVRVVIHWNPPDCPEHFYQESGRAGRDGRSAFSVVLSDDEDLSFLRELPERTFPSIDLVKHIYQQLCDYLQIPVGSGQEQYYDFRFGEFCKNFNLDHSQVVPVLKVLEQQGFLSVVESVFFSAKAMFTVTQESLRLFEDGHPELSEITKVLLRAYPGVFDERRNISERFIARTLRLHVDLVMEGLKRIAAFGIIEYLPQKETPQIHLLYNRAPAQYLNIDHEQYLERKSEFRSRVEAMVSYLRTRDCRMRFLLHYFGETGAADCGTCDNCLAKKNGKVA